MGVEADWLRAYALKQVDRGPHRVRLLAIAARLEGLEVSVGGDLGAAELEEAFGARGITLLPWQRDKLFR